jgi:hypothetical protein
MIEYAVHISQDSEDEGDTQLVDAPNATEAMKMAMRIETPLKYTVMHVAEHGYQTVFGLDVEGMTWIAVVAESAVL